MSDAPLTKTGNIPVHYAAAVCYAPIMSINLLASIGFLAMEPKENTSIRFHAAQSLLVQAVWFAAVMVSMVLMFVLPFLGGFLVVIALGISDTIGSLTGYGVMLLNLLVFLVVLIVVFGGILGQFALTVLAALEKDPRVPVLAGFAERFTA